MSSRIDCLDLASLCSRQFSKCSNRFMSICFPVFKCRPFECRSKTSQAYVASVSTATLLTSPSPGRPPSRAAARASKCTYSRATRAAARPVPRTPGARGFPQPCTAPLRAALAACRRSPRARAAVTTGLRPPGSWFSCREQGCSEDVGGLR